MQQPLVSVIIPIYNVEQYLDRCIRSVAEQTYKNLEIILVDDGSTDGCPQICDSWAGRDGRIKVVHKQNAGLGAARNTGIESATGRYIFFIDSDDYIDAATVKRCVSAAVKNGAEVVLFGSADVYDDGTVIRRELRTDRPLYSGAEVMEVLAGLFTYEMGFGVSACMKMFDLDLIKSADIRFMSERQIISEDAFFVLEYFSKASAVAIVAEGLYYYYKRSNSLTMTYKADRCAGNNAFLLYCTDYIRKSGLPERLVSAVTARYHLYTIGALRQLAAADIGDKKAKIFEVLRDKTLMSTLRADVLRLEKGAVRLFFAALKLRLRGACYLMLMLRSRRK